MQEEKQEQELREALEKLKMLLEEINNTPNKDPETKEIEALGDFNSKVSIGFWKMTIAQGVICLLASIFLEGMIYAWLILLAIDLIFSLYKTQRFAKKLEHLESYVKKSAWRYQLVIIGYTPIAVVKVIRDKIRN